MSDAKLTPGESQALCTAIIDVGAAYIRGSGIPTARDGLISIVEAAVDRAVADERERLAVMFNETAQQHPPSSEAASVLRAGALVISARNEPKLTSARVKCPTCRCMIEEGSVCGCCAARGGEPEP